MTQELRKLAEAEVNALNAWGIAAHTAIEALQAKLGDAIQSSAHWQHQFTEAQAENERLDKENTDSLVSLATAIQHRDGFRKQLDYHRHEMDDLEEDYSNLQAKLDAAPKALAPEQVEAAWRAGWAACRDAEFVGQEAEDEAWGMSETCANADWESAEEAAHGIGGTPS